MRVLRSASIMPCLMVAAEPDGVQTVLLFVPFLVFVVIPVTITRARAQGASSADT